jgi:hypothetical protein
VTSRPTVSQWQELCGELGETARRLLADGPELMRRSRHPARDGYPTSSLSGGARTSDVSDPTGTLAAARADGGATDPVNRSVEDMLRFTRAAVDALRRADAARAGAFPPAEQRDEVAARCVVHAAYGLDEPARSGERCRWCNDWRKAHGFTDPPERAIRTLEDQRVERDLRSAA